MLKFNNLLLSVFLLQFLIACKNTLTTRRQILVKSELVNIKQVLDSVYKLDQSVRNIDMNKILNDSSQSALAYKRIEKADSINQKKVIDILNHYGWLPQSLIGSGGAKTIYLVIQHSNDSIIKHYLPMMERLAKKGEASKIDAVTMCDRLLMFSGRKQIYGTQAANWVRSDGSLVIWPIKNPSKVNLKRKKIGFTTTVEQNATRLKAIYNPKEKLP